MKLKITNLITFIKNLFINNNIRNVKLETLLKVKTNLEQSIRNDWEFLGKLITKKTTETEAFLTAFYAIEKKNLQLVYFKLAQQKANLKTHSDGTSNFAKIYELSNLNATKEYLENVKKKIAKLKLNKVEFDGPNKLLIETVRKIQDINTKLSEFNRTQTAQVQLVSGLNLL